MFVKPAGGWSSATDTAKLAASDGGGADYLGFSVGVSSDGTTIVAGAPFADAAYVFVKSPVGWASGTQAAKLASNGSTALWLGWSVGVSGDGSTVVAGAPGTFIGATPDQGAAYVFYEPSVGWVSGTEAAVLTTSDGAADDELGGSVALSADGTTVVPGASGAAVGGNSMQGAAYVFGLLPQSSAPPTISGVARQGQTLTESHGTWSGGASSYTYQWTDCNASGSSCTPIAGATGQTYTLGASDVGHTIRVVETAHNLAGAASAASGATAMVTPATGVVVHAPFPALSALRLSPREVSIAGRLVKHRCVKPARTNHTDKPCARPITLRISYTLNMAASVTVTIKRLVSGKRVNGRCVRRTTKNARHRRCMRAIGVPGTIALSGHVGANRFTFNGRIGGRTLDPGSYQLIVTPSAGGTRGPPNTVVFRIVG